MEEEHITSLVEIVNNIYEKISDSRTDVDSETNKLVFENYFIQKCLSADPRLMEESIKPLYMKELEANKGMLKFASAIDNVDMVLAPIETVLKALPNPIGIPIYATIKTVEEAVKIFYAATYLAKTGDTKSALIWAGNEGISILAPAGNMINMIRVYKMNVERHIRDQTASKFIDEMIEKKGHYGETRYSDIGKGSSEKHEEAVIERETSDR